MSMRWLLFGSVFFLSWAGCFADKQDTLPAEDELLQPKLEEQSAASNVTYEEEDWGEGLKVLVTYRPNDCQHRAKTGDVIHYHYVGRLGNNGQEFGKSFDYNTPYIVALGHGRIIAGMDRGLMGTCLWERRRITIPPHLGYGERGVGTSIPPNSVLVFYIRMIKIERNGHALGEDEKLEDIWETALYRYTAQEWEQTVDMIEESLRLFSIYENQTLHCLRECQTAAELTPAQQKIVKDYSGEDESFNRQFMVYAARGRCIRDCKARSLPSHLRYLDPTVVKEFRQKKPYSFLHYAYYQLENYEEAAKCCFTYHHHNPTDQTALNSLPYYRLNLNLTNDQFVSREPIISPSQAAYTEGKTAYNAERWLDAVNHFERALTLYRDELSTCRLLCEDALSINLTEPDMSEHKRKLFEEHNLVPDTMEYYELLSLIVREVLTCRVDCMEQVARMEAKVIEGYFGIIFNYLQYSYYKLGQLKKAAENAATFLAIDPSDLTMASNIRYYKSKHQVPNDFFVPRAEYVHLQQRWESEKRLVHLADFGRVKKRSGQRGDTEQKTVPPRHTEL